MSNQIQKKRIVLLGKMGSGKSTLFNLITGANQETKQGGEGVTNQLFLKGSQQGEGFDVLDTPGNGVLEKKFENSAMWVAALIEGPVSQICGVVKAGRERYDLVVNEIKSLISYCAEYRKKEEQELEIKIRNFCKVQAIIFCSKNDAPEKICQKFDIMLKETKQKQLFYNFYEIHKLYDAIDINPDQQEIIEKQRFQIKAQFTKIASKYIKFIKAQKKEPGMVDLMHNLILSITEKAQQLVTQFQTKFGAELNKQYDENGFNLQYLHDIFLKKEIWRFLQEVIELAQARMKEFGGHCYNFLRKCPYCEQVWLKVEGCEGKVNCGNYPAQKMDNFNLEDDGPIRITFKETENSLEIAKRQKPPWKIWKQTQYYFQGEIKQQESKAGCGKVFQWSKASPLDEETIKKLLSPDLADFFSKEDMSDAERQSQNLEKAFNETFKLQVQKSMQEMKKE